MYGSVFVTLHSNQKNPQHNDYFVSYSIDIYVIIFSLNILDAEQAILSLYGDNIPIHLHRYLQTL